MLFLRHTPVIRFPPCFYTRRNIAITIILAEKWFPYRLTSILTRQPRGAHGLVHESNAKGFGLGPGSGLLIENFSLFLTIIYRKKISIFIGVHILLQTDRQTMNNYSSHVARNMYLAIQWVNCDGTAKCT